MDFRRRLSRFSRENNDPLIKGILLLMGAGLVITVSLYTIGLKLVSNDEFCASCHIEPETTYFLSSLDTKNANTLAVFHTSENTRCIECHSRKGISGRVWAQWGGLQNLIFFLSDNYDIPSKTTRPVGDSGCSKCHSDMTWVNERPGHYHSPLLRSRWQSAGGPDNTCEACHPSHDLNSSQADRFMDNDLIENICDNCHDKTGVDK